MFTKKKVPYWASCLDLGVANEKMVHVTLRLKNAFIPSCLLLVLLPPDVLCDLNEVIWK